MNLFVDEGSTKMFIHILYYVFLVLKFVLLKNKFNETIFSRFAHSIKNVCNASFCSNSTYTTI